jgi:hypothetical protein
LRSLTFLIAKSYRQNGGLFLEFHWSDLLRKIAQPYFAFRGTSSRAARAGAALKISAALQKIKRYEGKGNNGRKYGDRQRPIDMLFRAASNYRHRRQSLEYDFSHLAYRSASRLIDCTA